MRTEKEKMIAGELYRPDDPELQALTNATQAWLARYNASLGAPPERLRQLLRKKLSFVGEGVIVRPPFFCDYGFNIRIGSGAFLNFNCVILDVCEVSIGDGAQIGPSVHIYAADHPRDPVQRRAGLELGRPVRIGANVWIGGGARILPGVTIGADAVVGAVAVVTRDVPAGVVVAGNPASLISK